jgi:hypothetical protein
MAWIIFIAGRNLRTSGHVLSLAAMFIRASVVPLRKKLAFMFHTPKRVINHLYDSIASRYYVDAMKSKGLHIRISERRLNKLKVYAASKEKTMTQLVEDWIDRLPAPEGLEVSVPPTSRRDTPP